MRVGVALVASMFAACSDGGLTMDVGRDVAVDGGPGDADARLDAGTVTDADAPDVDVQDGAGGDGVVDAGPGDSDVPDGEPEDVFVPCIPDQVEHVFRFGTDTIAPIALSDRGRVVGFTTNDALVTADTNALQDAYVKDRLTGELEAVSVSVAGDVPGGKDVLEVLGDARSVIVIGRGPTLNPRATAPELHAYLRQRDAGRTEWLSSFSLSGVIREISSTARGGELLLFGSAERASADATDIRVYDRFRDVVELINVDGQGQRAEGQGAPLDMTPDGRFVLFASDSERLLGRANEPGTGWIYVRDRMMGTTELVCTSSIGDACNAGCLPRADISDDGRYVAFVSNASNLLPGEPANGLGALYIKDRWTGQVRVEPPTSTSLTIPLPGDFALSCDGQHIVVQAGSGNVSGNDSVCNYGASGYYVRNLVTGAAMRLGCPQRAPPTAHMSPSPWRAAVAWSRDSNFIAFPSDAEDTPGTLDDRWDGFIFHYCPSQRE